MGLLEMTNRNLARWAVAVVAVGVLLATPLVAEGHHRADHQRGPRAGTEVPNNYIVMLRPGASNAGVQRSHDVRSPRSFEAGFNGFTGEVPPGRLIALRNDPRVELVIPDRTLRQLPGPPGKAKRQGSTTGAEIVPEGVLRIGAAPGADLGVTGSGIGVAVIDSGVDRGHVDLNVSSSCFDAFGGDCQDETGHGTHVAGSIGALRNGIGVVGVAPGATIYAVKVLDPSDGGSDAGLLAGIEWVLTNADRVSPPIRVANMSLGRPGSVSDNPALSAAIGKMLEAGIVVVASAGNDPDVEAVDQVPAGFTGVITVASSTALAGANTCSHLTQPIPADTLSYFSSYSLRSGDSGVDITAPGSKKEDVGSSCVIEPIGLLSLFPDDSLASMSGTSMAAPLVSGVAALLLERNGSLSPDSVASAIVGGATSKSTAPSTAVVRDRAVARTGGILSAPGALSVVSGG